MPYTTTSFKSLAFTSLLLALNLTSHGVHARVGATKKTPNQHNQQQLSTTDKDHNNNDHHRHLTTTTEEDDTSSGAVYVMTNRVGGIGNSVLTFNRNATDGTLTRVGLFDTGGLGGLAGGLTTFPGGFPTDVFGTPNDALASQNSLLLSESKRCLFASNAGSDTITTFRVTNDGRSLDRVDVYPSGGNFPVSVTQRGNTVYVLNAGGEASVSGFRYGDRLCTLRPLERSTRSMRNDNTNPPFFLDAPAQVSITPDGNGLVATLKGQNTIHYWALSTLGFPSDQQVISPSNGFTPFSFAFDDHGHLLVSEAFGAAPVAPLPPTANNGAVSSYNINEDGTLSVISKSIPTGQTATCWIRYFNGRAYTSNNEPPNPSISIFSVDSASGVVGIIDQDAANGEQGIDRAIDLSLTSDGSYLYALSTGSLLEDGAGRPSISVFKNEGDSLELVEIVRQGLPLSTTSLNFAETEGVFGLAVL